MANYAYRTPSGAVSFDADALLADGEQVTRIVLTVAHLDHTPENCADENLMALCQKCHLTYDAKHHAQTASQTRHKRKAIVELF